MSRSARRTPRDSSNWVGVAAAEQADHEDEPAVDVEVLVEGLRHRQRALGVVGAVDDDERDAVDDLEPAGHLHPHEPGLDDLGVERPGEERLDRGDGQGGVLTLVRAVQGDEHVVEQAARRAHVDEPPADRDLVRLGDEVVAAHPQRSPAAASKIGRRSRSSSPSTRNESGLTMPAFSCAIAVRQSPTRSVWSWPMVVSTATGGVGHVGGVVATEQPDLDHGHVDRDLGEPGERRGGAQLEVGRRHAGQHLELGDLRQHRGEVVVADRTAGPGVGALDRVGGDALGQRDRHLLVVEADQVGVADHVVARRRAAPACRR